LFTKEELEMIGFGYDQVVRFMFGADDPRLRQEEDEKEDDQEESGEY
jgi:hypothetical protein